MALRCGLTSEFAAVASCTLGPAAGCGVATGCAGASSESSLMAIMRGTAPAALPASLV